MEEKKDAGQTPANADAEKTSADADDNKDTRVDVDSKKKQDSDDVDNLPETPEELKKMVKKLRAENGRRRFNANSLEEKLQEYEKKEAERIAKEKEAEEKRLLENKQFEELAKKREAELNDLRKKHEDVLGRLTSFEEQEKKAREKKEEERQKLLKELPADLREKYKSADYTIVSERLDIYKSTNASNSKHNPPAKDGAGKTVDDKKMTQWEKNRMKILGIN